MRFRALVGETGRALTRIMTRVLKIGTIINQIAAFAQEQAAGLQQVNDAVNHMDRTTQQNAAMVEQSTAASQSLADEAERLSTLVQPFKVESAEPASARRFARAARSARFIAVHPGELAPDGWTRAPSERWLRARSARGPLVTQRDGRSPRPGGLG